MSEKPQSPQEALKSKTPEQEVKDRFWEILKHPAFHNAFIDNKNILRLFGGNKDRIQIYASQVDPKMSPKDREKLLIQEVWAASKKEISEKIKVWNSTMTIIQDLGNGRFSVEQSDDKRTSHISYAPADQILPLLEKIQNTFQEYDADVLRKQWEEELKNKKVMENIIKNAQNAEPDPASNLEREYFQFV